MSEGDTNYFSSGSCSVYYSTVDSIVCTHSKLCTRNLEEYVKVRFERVNNNNGFDFAECEVPLMGFKKCFGFSEDELM